MSHLRACFAPVWLSIQTTLFPWVEDELGPLTEKQQQLVHTLEIIRVEDHLPRRITVPGRPAKDRAAIARAFVAKAVYDMPTTRILLDRLATDVALRRICGWERKRAVPSESVFSRAFAACATTQLPLRVHEALIQKTHHDRVVGHIPLIDINTRRNTWLKDERNAEARRRTLLGFQLPEDVRYNERTAAERVYGRLKDEFGGRHVRVRGPAKVMCHCMFGVLALTADQLMRLVT